MSATVIGRVRVWRPPGTDADPSGAVARRLAGLDLAPAGVSPSAVLCIRRLEDPAPGTLRLDGPDEPRLRAWSSAVAASVAQVAREAARPADGPVPAGAQAVLFRDRVELLACLAEAAARPEETGAWWWRGLVRGPRLVADAWLREVTLVPAVVSLLEGRGTLRLLAVVFDHGDLVRLTSAVLADAGLPALVHPVSAGGAATKHRPGGRGRAPSTAVPAAGSSGREPGFAMPGDLAALHGPARALAFAALSVHRHPALTRDPAFRAVVSRWAARAVDARRAATGPEPADAPGTAAPRSRPARSRAAPYRRPTLPHRPSTPPGLAAAGAADDRVADLPPSPDRRVATTRGVGGLETGGPAAERPVRDASDEVVRTGLGGSFSLLVLALDLGLYGDFTRPAAPGIRLHPWDLVTMLATELGARSAHREDPLWSLLARLAGRPPTSRPGTGWRPPATWRVPPDWLRAVPATRPWTWWSSNGRLRVEHPAGFAVLDGRLPAPSPRDVRRWLGQAGRVHATVRRVRPAVDDRPHGGRAADRWVAELARYVRARLSSRLGVRDDAGLRRVLLERPAQVFVGPGSVDVVMDLDELPVLVRSAGLDRDPGPVPAAHRSVRFHYR